MPSALESSLDQSKKGKIIRSALDSETFDCDVTIHVDGLVGSATISPSGRDVALASPEGLAIIDLDSPYSQPRRLSSHGLPWLVVDVQWSPFAARDFWVASTANHRCLVWNLNMRDDSTTGAIEHSLQGHTRAITDINFSAHHPDILATCAVDGDVHCWDLRKPRRPVLTFCDWFAGATQVKFNRQDQYILASSHDRWLHIWDERKPSVPLKSINAHTSKIYGLDWNRTRQTGIVTCSLDKSIKFWDYGKSDEPERIIQTEFPVWRARHTPFGWGLLAMPQNDPGDLYLYDRRLEEGQPIDTVVEPTNIFPGHGSHKVKEFLWRSRGSVDQAGVDNRDFQLVSWGEDNQLRLHCTDNHILESVGHTKGGEARKNMKFTRQGATYKTYRSIDDPTTRERRSATMSDPRPGTSGGGHQQSALTAGMQTMTANYARSSAASAWKGPAMKAKAKSWKNGDRSADQLGWMKGITLNKRKGPVPGTPERKESRDSTMFESTYQQWGEAKTLNDEVVQLHEQLPNVKWDDVDMENLTLKAALKGPWGMDGDTIYIKVTVDIPRNYPQSRGPKFFIEKAALMDDQVHKKLERDLSNMSHQFAERGQRCLELAFSYLLGETDLASSDTFFKNVRDLDDEIDGLADESSSEDDEDEIPPGASAMMSQELTASTELDATLATPHRPVIPPLPITCGARFSNDGQLVCFFPTKEEKARTMLFASDTFRERPKGEPNFAGFGRLQADSPPPKRAYTEDASAADEQSESGESDESTSSTDSETTYMNKTNHWYLPVRRFRKAFSGTHSIHSSGGGTGVGTGTGTATSRRRPGKARHIISIHNMNNDLPSKPEFAREYAVFGDGAEVCEHNAKVADKYGCPDLANVWRYAALLLRKDIPLEVLEGSTRRESVLVIARDAMTRFEDGYPSFGEHDDHNLAGRVKWGEHPLAKHFIRGLFDYFEKTADIQMLAMLSCIFSESSTEDGIAYAESHLSQPMTPLPMKAPSFSLDYFPTDAHLWVSNMKSHANSAISTPKTVHTPIHVAGSYDSERHEWVGDPASNSYSCGETPPTRTPRDHLVEGESQSLSTSPSNKLLLRANSALTSTFSASFPRPFTSVASTSPPSRKKPSPGENFLAGLTPSNITWGSSAITGAPTSEPSATARNSYSDDEFRRDENLALVCYNISTTVEDQAIFDDDGWLVTPILEPSRAAIYAGYRSAYAEMLQMWDQRLARLEILKFDVLKGGGVADTTIGAYGGHEESFRDSYHSTDNLSHTNVPHPTSPMILANKKEQLQSLLASGRGIDVTGVCRIHEMKLTPSRTTHATNAVGGAVGTCDRCPRRTQTQLFCVFCHEPIDALYPPCLDCGCAIHDDCLSEWHGAGETECPAGDECECTENASNGIVESWDGLMAALRNGKEKASPDEREAKAARSRHEANEKHEWESLPGPATLPAADSQGKPLYKGQSPQADLLSTKINLPARLLRRSAGPWGSSNSLRKNSTGSTYSRK